MRLPRRLLRPAGTPPTTAAACLTALVLAGIAVLTAVTVAGGWRRQHDAAFVTAVAALWCLFALAVVLLRRVPARAVAPLVLGGALAIGLAALIGPPNTSDDSARYAWDGIVQDAGVSPYRYVPADPRLAALRPDWLFPAAGTDATGSVACPGPPGRATAEVGTGRPLCTVINRPTVPTIYPPVAEAAFALVRLPLPRDAGWWPMQALGLAVALATTLLLLRALPRLGRDPRRAALYAWCPLVAAEAVTNAHVDALAALLALGATLLAASGRRWRGGAMLGLAIATKFLPVLIAPPLLRRRPVPLVLAAVGTVALVYLPHVVATGGAVIGYLPGYLNEEGYDDGTRSALLSLVLPGSAATLAGALLLGIVAVVALVRANAADPWTGQVVVIAAALVLASPRYSWYALLLVPFVAMAGRWEWLGVALALTLRQLVPDLTTVRVALAAAVLVTVIGTIVRSRARAPASRMITQNINIR